MSTYTRQIADFAANLKLTDIPPEVIARAKGVILDGLGCGLYGADLPWTNLMVNAIQRIEPHGGQSLLWGRNQTASAASATLVNGTMIQGYELDDSHLDASIHNCATVLPAAFAAAEMLGADHVDGKKLLLAIIAGFEIGPRVGMCMNGEEMVKFGWHAPAVVSAFPAAIAAGIVLGLNSDQHMDALGMAGTQSSGLMAAQYGSMFKRAQCAHGSQCGFYSAVFAAEGLTGIENIFDLEYGGYPTTYSHKSSFELARLVAGLGTKWEIMNYTIKVHACGGGNHTAIDAVDELVQETDLKADDVDEIFIGGTQGMVVHHGWHPYEPTGLTAAQIHAGFCVAVRLIEGEVFVDQMTDANVGRPDLVALANRIKVVRSVEREQRGHAVRKGADLEVRLKNGKVLKKSVDFVLGSPRRPLTSEQMAAKYRRLAAKALSPDMVSKVEKIVWDLDQAPTLKELIGCLAGEKR